MSAPKMNVAGPVGAASRRRRRMLALALCAAVGLVALWIWWPRAAIPNDPRLTFVTPYRNVRPNVKYVGQEACAQCHAQHAKTYREHPMGKSLASVESATAIERYGEAAKNPFDALGFRYLVERRGERVIHRETVADGQGRLICETEAEVHFAVGSGSRGRTYLSNRNGYLFQSPITWYAQKAAWDLSPGFERLHHHFGRPVPADCLFCHSNRALEVAESQNHYRSPIFEGHAIGCERCHGPGELHVRRHQTGDTYAGQDFTIVNPGRLEPALREAVCQQCHLQGIVRVLRRGRQPFDYRPGLPLQLFLAVFVKPPTEADPHKFVGQVEQMYASRCFEASNGKMGCISCHDPHVMPAADEKITYYRDRCLNCHADRGCSEPLAVRRRISKDDNCLQCHMPTGESDIQHHSITDHRILRKKGEVEPNAAAPPASAMPMMLFHRDLIDADDPEAPRDLGIALVDRVERYPAGMRRELGRLALPLLEAALQTDPNDVPALDAKAHALWAIGDAGGAAAAFDDVLTRSPRREISLLCAATLAMERKNADAAVPLWERAIAVNPWRHEFHFGLAQAHAERGAWPKSLASSQDAIRLNPANTAARVLLVQYFVEVRQMDQARAEFDRLLALHPPNEDALRRWFAKEVR
jgi:Tetratricopeptide repeat